MRLFPWMVFVLGWVVVIPAQAQSSKIAFSSQQGGDSDIYIMTATGSNVTRLTQDPAADFWPSLSRDGSQIVFVSMREEAWTRDLYLMNADGSGLRRLTVTPGSEPSPGGNDLPPTTIGPETPAFHPQGDRVVFSQGELYVVSTNHGATPERVIIAGGNGLTIKEQPVFSPDGRRIAFSAWTETETEPDSGIFILNSDIYVVNTNGTGLLRLTTDEGWDTAPSFSHDGTLIAFTRSESFTPGIYVVRSTGGAQRRVTPLSEQSFGSSAFSPDDGQIVFDASADTGSFDIFRIATNGTGLARLTTSLADDYDPSWAPGVVGPTLHLTLATNRVLEGNSGMTAVLATVSLSSAAANTVTVTLRTVDETALAGEDYMATSQTVSLPPGQLSRTVTISVVGDATHEKAEQFIVELTAPQNASISTARGSIAILNDDPLPVVPGRLAFTLYDGNYSDIFVMNPDRSATYNLTDTPTVDEFAPAWSPDGATIGFVSTDETNFFNDIFLINADGTGRRNLTATPERDEYNPSWSPDGSQLVFESSSTESGMELFIVSADGGTPRLLPTTPSFWFRPHRSPVWSSTGKIYFVQESNSVWSLRSIDPNGQNERVLTSARSDFAETISNPAVSPDGSRIVFMQLMPTEFDVQSDIMLINADGSGLVNLTSHPDEDVDPTFTADGTSVMFSSARDGRFDLYTVALPAAARGSAHQLVAVVPPPAQRWTTTAGDKRDPDWDRRSLAPSLLRISRNTTAAILRFTALSNRTYTVQSASALSGPWQNLTSVTAQRTTREVQVTDPISAAPARRFYRVVTPTLN